MTSSAVITPLMRPSASITARVMRLYLSKSSTKSASLSSGRQATTGDVAMGQSLYTSKGCLVCHAATGPTKANAMNAGGHIAHANTQGMGGQADANGQEYNDIAAYLATLFVGQGIEAVAFNTVRRVDVANVVLRTPLGN